MLPLYSHMAIENVQLLHKRIPQHSDMIKARIKQDKEKKVNMHGIKEVQWAWKKRSPDGLATFSSPSLGMATSTPNCSSSSAKLWTPICTCITTQAVAELRNEPHQHL